MYCFLSLQRQLYIWHWTSSNSPLLWQCCLCYPFICSKLSLSLVLILVFPNLIFFKSNKNYCIVITILSWFSLSSIKLIFSQIEVHFRIMVVTQHRLSNIPCLQPSSWHANIEIRPAFTDDVSDIVRVCSSVHAVQSFRDLSVHEFKKWTHSERLRRITRHTVIRRSASTEDVTTHVFLEFHEKFVNTIDTDIQDHDAN